MSTCWEKRAKEGKAGGQVLQAGQLHLVSCNMVIVIDETETEIEKLPSSLEEFFEEFPCIGEANESLTSIDHVDMWRDQVLFIKQRQQATSDYRENPNVRWIGKRELDRCCVPTISDCL